VRVGHGLAARRNAGGWAQSVRAGVAYARTSKPLPCRRAALPQVDPVGPALLRGPQHGVSAMAPGDARDATELQAQRHARSLGTARTIKCWTVQSMWSRSG
jgi:hypothetical protein